MAPICPTAWFRLATVSASTYLSYGMIDAMTSIEHEHCSSAWRVSPFTFMQPKT